MIIIFLQRSKGMYLLYWKYMIIMNHIMIIMNVYIG